MTQSEDAAGMTVKASIMTPESPLNDLMSMIPSLIVEAVRAPPRIAPAGSRRELSIMAPLYAIDLEETLVAQEFATSSGILIKPMENARLLQRILTCAHHECFEKDKNCPNDKKVGVLVEHLLEGTGVASC
jgi:hypothetical protein